MIPVMETLKRNIEMKSLFWFRRDLRLLDNAGLFEALSRSQNVRPIFIFDPQIFRAFNNPSDKRMPFLRQRIELLKAKLKSIGSDLDVRVGEPLAVFKDLFAKKKYQALYLNADYEPASLLRDARVEELCAALGIEFCCFKDQVVFEKDEILTQALKPFTVYTPYKNKWLSGVSDFYIKAYDTEKHFSNFEKFESPHSVPSLGDLGFTQVSLQYPPLELKKELLSSYAAHRDYPSQEQGTSRLGVHLRFGTVSVRELVRRAIKVSPVYLSELIWREFFMQVLFHFPKSESESFRPQFDKLPWRDSPQDFQRWTCGETGYPLVDAGMRELNATGHMHNRVRMVVASFLTKHLLIHWKQGERYFARELLDYELASNVGNWQWAAGTGCDAAPYFRIFNPTTQAERFDPKSEYIRKWVPEFGTSKYPAPMVDHAKARARALEAFSLLKG